MSYLGGRRSYNLGSNITGWNLFLNITNNQQQSQVCSNVIGQMNNTIQAIRTTVSTSLRKCNI